MRTQRKYSTKEQRPQKYPSKAVRRAHRSLTAVGDFELRLRKKCIESREKRKSKRKSGAQKRKVYRFYGTQQ